MVQIPTEVEPLEKGTEIAGFLDGRDEKLRMTAEIGGQPGGAGLGRRDDKEIRAESGELVMRNFGLLQAPKPEGTIQRDGIPFHGPPVSVECKVVKSPGCTKSSRSSTRSTPKHE